MNKKIVLSGYFGFDNIGDEAVMYSVIEALKHKIENVDITVLSANVEKTQRLYGVKAVDRWNKKEIYRAIKESDMLVSGGGSLLQDVSSANSPLYYLGIIKLAQWLKKPVVVYAQGIGPLKLKRNRYLTSKILGKVATITVRDKESADELRDLGVKRIVNVTADPVLFMAHDGVDKLKAREILEDIHFDYAKKTVMVSLRQWKDNVFVGEVAKTLDRLVNEGYQVVLIPMQYDKDKAVLVEVSEAMQNDVLILDRNCEPLEMLGVLNFADVILGMRLHALIMGVSLNKPVVGIEYDPKVASFMKSVGSNKYVPYNKVKAGELYNLLVSDFEGYENMEDLLHKVIMPACFANSILFK